mmetsp:Transcript_49653/g.142017  ORF Transcript_49653/g.142017 Transcript_49653/m.142017 type:complete len:486 (-) Transcript_49653:122-1579(-)
MAATDANMGKAGEDVELDLPEHEFTYLAGSTDRPWAHFTGRWKAIKPVLAEMLRACGSERPLRIVDVGSCTGFFSLQAASGHPEADIVAVEGSVGIGNGTVGMAGSARAILKTEAVRTHLRWIQRLELPNCFVAPEVWDYVRVRELASQGRPICDVMFLLSVVHHIDNVSFEQYTSQGLSRLQGLVDLLAKLLLLAPRHFVELPNKPWMAAAYEAYGTQRAILEAATKASGLPWKFRGPIYSAEWFGQRELWVLEAESAMPVVDVQVCPFMLLYRGEEQDVMDVADELDVPEDQDLLAGLGAYDDVAAGYGDLADPDYGASSLAGGSNLTMAAAGSMLQPHGGAAGGLADTLMDGQLGDAFPDALLNTQVCQHLGGALVDPGLMILTSGPIGPVEDKIGEALSSAPTALLLAHLTLREAMMEAQDLLKEVRSSGIMDESNTPQQRTAAPEMAAAGRVLPALTLQRGRGNAAGAAPAGRGAHAGLY